MTQRMSNPAAILPDAYPAILALKAAAEGGGVPTRTLELAHLRASQVNGCAACVHGGLAQARRGGETEDRLRDVAGWRDSGAFTDAERAALALTEAVTRLADQPDAVPDAVWAEAARHYDERGLAALVLWAATTNVFNRLNVATRQEPGQWG